MFFEFVNLNLQSNIHDDHGRTARRLLSMQDQILECGNENTSSCVQHVKTIKRCLSSARGQFFFSQFCIPICHRRYSATEVKHFFGFCAMFHLRDGSSRRFGCLYYFDNNLFLFSKNASDMNIVFRLSAADMASVLLVCFHSDTEWNYSI